MESHFIGTLRVEHLYDSWYRLLNGLGFYSKKHNATFYIPAGFVTDYETVHRLPVVYMLTKHTMVWSSVLHDMLYRWPLSTRGEADSLFNEAGYVRELMLNRNDNSWFKNMWMSFRRNMMVGAVRLGGGFYYKSVPGCLNLLAHKQCTFNCQQCPEYYSYWKLCKIEGYNSGLYYAHLHGDLTDFIAHNASASTSTYK